MRKYPVELVEDLQNSHETIIRQGAKVVLKKTRDTLPGIIDPWERKYHIMTELSPKGNSASDFVDAFRDACGSHNYNLNEKEIYTKYKELYLMEHRTVGMWYYRLRRSARTLRPCLIYMHGGGWIAGNVHTMENSCKLIAELADAVVFNIDYSLAPEGPYPVAVEQLWYIVSYIYRKAEEFGIDRNKIMVAGDSAGGNLAAALTLRNAREGKNYIAAQYLIYPCVVLGKNRPDGYSWNKDDYCIAKQDEPILRKILHLEQNNPEENMTEAIEKIYVPNPEDISRPDVSPMLSNNLSKQAKTFIITAEFDLLRPQAEFYASQLLKAGVDVKTSCYSGCYHAFFEKLGYVPQSEAVCIEIARELKNL